MTTADELVDRELTLNRFKRLIGEVVRGQIVRNTFEPWEVDVLLDFSACELAPRRRTEILKQYQRAVERQLESDSDSGVPMKLSQFLIERARRAALPGQLVHDALPAPASLAITADPLV